MQRWTTTKETSMLEALWAAWAFEVHYETSAVDSKLTGQTGAFSWWLSLNTSTYPASCFCESTIFSPVAQFGHCSARVKKMMCYTKKEKKLTMERGALKFDNRRSLLSALLLSSFWQRLGCRVESSHSSSSHNLVNENKLVRKHSQISKTYSKGLEFKAIGNSSKAKQEQCYIIEKKNCHCLSQKFTILRTGAH